MPFRPFLRLGANQAGRLQDLQVGRNGRLRQIERRGDVVDVDARLAGAAAAGCGRARATPVRAARRDAPRDRSPENCATFFALPRFAVPRICISFSDILGSGAGRAQRRRCRVWSRPCAQPRLTTLAGAPIAPEPQSRRRLGLLLRGPGAGLTARAIASGRRGSGRPSSRAAQRPGNRTLPPQDRDPARLGGQERRPRHGRRLPRIRHPGRRRAGRHSWRRLDADRGRPDERLDGKTSFVLGVEARTPDDRHGGRFSQSLAGKQDWYGVQGGIWKPARLEARDPDPHRRLAVRTSYDLATGAVVAQGQGFGAGAGEAPPHRVARRRVRGGTANSSSIRAEFEVELRRSRPGRLVARRPQPLRPRRRTHARRSRRRRRRADGRLPALRGERRTALSERRALLHVRRARSGLAPRRGVPAAERSLSRTAIPQRQGDGAQHAALPCQDSGPALFRSGRPARPRSSGSTCPTCSSSRPRRARRCGEIFGSRSPATGIIRPSASGRCSTKDGESISTTIPTTGAG